MGDPNTRERTMTRTTKTITRRDWERLLADLDGDTTATLRADLDQWDDGETCERIEISVDSLGRVDSESSPRPASEE